LRKQAGIFQWATNVKSFVNFNNSKTNLALN
jgi:hypothetical protein